VNDNKGSEKYTLHLGDCIEVLRGLPDNSVDSIVTDPPYELGFMGKAWDASGIANNVEMWREALRVLKPGGHLLAFSGSRTYHRMTCAIEDAGFEVRDQIMWVYGSGFPKSLDVSKAIDKAAGAVREVIGKGNGGMVRVNKRNAELGYRESNYEAAHTNDITAPATDAARQWQGWGTALKPAHEPICVARKPLVGTVAANVLAHGTGALNIDGCRVGTDTVKTVGPADGGRKFARKYDDNGENLPNVTLSEHTGRWPANIIHDGSDEVVAGFPSQAGASAPVLGHEPSSMTKSVFGQINRQARNAFHGDTGSAARFFYCAKASRADRNAGLTGFEKKRSVDDDWISESRKNTPSGGLPSAQANHHPTVKPTDLMAYLCRLVTPPNGTVLDPFMGSGSTGKASMREGFRFIGIDITPEYHAIARARIEHEICKSKISQDASAPKPMSPVVDLPQMDLFVESGSESEPSVRKTA